MCIYSCRKNGVLEQILQKWRNKILASYPQIDLSTVYSDPTVDNQQFYASFLWLSEHLY
jgi:hypothetical protein